MGCPGWVIVAVWVTLLSMAWTIDGKFGQQEDFLVSNDPDFVIGDFLLIQGGSVLLVVQGYNDTPTLYALDVSGPKMNVIASQRVCQGSGANPWIANRLLAYDDKSFFLDCYYIPDLSHVYDNISLVTWNGKGFEIVDWNYFPVGGLSFIPTSSQPQYLWLLALLGEPVIRQIDYHTKPWTETTIPISGPYSFFSPASFVSTSSKYAILNGYKASDANLYTFKVSLPDGKITAESISHAPLNATVEAFTLTTFGKASYQLVLTEDHLTSYLVPWNFDTLQSGPPLALTWPYWTVYDGGIGFNGFASSGNSVFIRMYVDASDNNPPPGFKPTAILQISVGSDPLSLPVLVDTVKYNYEYTHGLVASSSYIYADTDDAVISRWSITQPSY